MLACQSTAARLERRPPSPSSVPLRLRAHIRIQAGPTAGQRRCRAGRPPGQMFARPARGRPGRRRPSPLTQKALRRQRAGRPPPTGARRPGSPTGGQRCPRQRRAASARAAGSGTRARSYVSCSARQGRGPAGLSGALPMRCFQASLLAMQSAGRAARAGRPAKESLVSRVSLRSREAGLSARTRTEPFIPATATFQPPMLWRPTTAVASWSAGCRWTSSQGVRRSYWPTAPERRPLRTMLPAGSISRSTLQSARTDDRGLMLIRRKLLSKGALPIIMCDEQPVATASAGSSGGVSHWPSRRLEDDAYRGRCHRRAGGATT